MTDQNAINILVAEDNAISRELMQRVLENKGFETTPAEDGNAAIEAIQHADIHLALVDINMEPKGGFEFIKYLRAHRHTLPIVIVTADKTTDMLIQAQQLAVDRILQKPIDPEKLIQIVDKLLEKYKKFRRFKASEVHETQHDAATLMQRTISLAERNINLGKGGPFGAIVANAFGEILGEGANGITSRIDPTAHAEIMAIRKAAEKLGRADLSDCLLYCSSEPTMMGKALIQSVGITRVYYALSHDEVNKMCRREKAYAEVTYEKMESEHAHSLFKNWQIMDNKIED